MSSDHSPVLLKSILLLLCCGASFSEEIVRWRPFGQLTPSIEYVAQEVDGKCTIVATDPRSGTILFSSEMTKEEADEIKVATQALLPCRDVDYGSTGGQSLRILVYEKDEKDPTAIRYNISGLYNDPAGTFIPKEDIANIAVIKTWLSLIERMFRKRGLERFWE